MKKLGFILITLTLFLVSCNNTKDPIDKDPLDVEVLAIIKEVYIDRNLILVEGIGKDNPLGDLSMVNIEDAVITKMDKPATINDLREKDEITLKIKDVLESYPTQAKSSMVNVTLSYTDVENDNDTIIKDVVNVKLYFLVYENADVYLVEEVHTIDNVSDLAAESLKSLRDLSPYTKNAQSPLPPTTIINDIYIKDKIVYVDFSKEIKSVDYGPMAEGLKVLAIVNTLTQLQTIDGVVFTIDGSSNLEGWRDFWDGNNGPFKKDLTNITIYDEAVAINDYRNIKLYFLYSGEKDLYLVQEDHQVKNVSEIAKLALESLRDNKPQTKNAYSPIYNETKINNISIKERIIYVDFSKDIANSNSGASQEALSVVAIVNTLTQFSTVDGVVFTIDGSSDIEVWLSHIGNVDKPFYEDMSVVKKR